MSYIRAIIAFSAAIPPRPGLSLEMSVGVTLMVLGAMNLSGVTHIDSSIASPQSKRKKRSTLTACFIRTSTRTVDVATVFVDAKSSTVPGGLGS